MFTLQHTGYPVAGRPILDDEWKNYSKHASLWATIRKMDKCTNHLDYGQWDDHYRILGIDGKPVGYYAIEEERFQHRL